MISELGPIVKLGTMSVAVGFGNEVKIISAGHEYFDKTIHVNGLGLGMTAVASRRKKGAGRGGGRVS